MTVYNDQVNKYIVDLFAIQDQALLHILDDSPRQGLPTINVKPEEGRFLQFLVRACGVKKAVEIGTLGGYSGTWIARGLLPGGKLITLEKDPLHASVAAEHFKEAGLENIVEIRIGDAHSSLQTLEAEGPFDFVFIDAEKDGYPEYLDWAMGNTRQGGLIAAHNAFRKGSVVGLADKDQYTEIMQAFNRRVAGDARLLSTIYPAGDGMLVAVKIA
jgi:predicted O-methyltransferase YrrM